MDLRNGIEIKYLKFVAIDNSLTDPNILEDFYRVSFQPITIDDVSFYFSDERFHWFKQLIENKQLLDENGNCVSVEKLQKYLKEYGKGFRVGYFNYLDKTKKEISLFNKEDKILINKIFSKVYDALNVSILPIQIVQDVQTKNNRYKVIEDALFDGGIRDGEIYQAWCIIAEYNPMFESIWSKKISDEEPVKKEIEQLSDTISPAKQNRNENIFSNNGFVLFTHILENFIKEKNIRGRYKDLSYFYRKLYNDNFIHQKPEPFRYWFMEYYDDEFSKLNTLLDTKNTQRKKDYSTALDWFKRNE